MAHSFVIDSLPESAALYRDTHALAVVDVFRATTCIVTALFQGHAVYPVATIGEAVTVAGGLRDARLAGEQNGIKPPNFDYDDSLPDRFVYLKERVVTDRLRPTTPSLRFPA